jgi:hypothetical protein
MEKHKNWTEYNDSVTKKLCVALCLSTCIIPLTIYNDSDKWYEKGNLADTIFWVLINNAIISPILYIINPVYQLKRYRRWRLIRNYKKYGSYMCSQAKANFLFEGPQINLATRNAHLIKTYMVMMLYAPMLPIGILIGAITLVIDYWATKYMLLRVHAWPKKHGVGIYDNLLGWIPWGIYLHIVRYI